MKDDKRSQKFRLGLLEAAVGVEPALRWCKSVAMSKKKRTGTDLVDPQDKEKIQEQLAQMRRERLQGKLHKLQKSIKQALKRAKNFHIRKFHKRIRQMKVDGQPTERKDEQLMALKALKLDDARFGEWVLWKLVIRKSPYLEEKFRLLNSQFEEKERLDGKLGYLLSLAAFVKSMKSLREELEAFVRKLYHEESPEPLKTDAEKESRAVEVITKGQAMAEDEESYNVSDSFDEVEEEDLHEPSRDQNLNSSCFVSLNGLGQSSTRRKDSRNTTAKKKKNRPGQAARRLLWEQKYGKDAKHLQASEPQKKFNGNDRKSFGHANAQKAPRELQKNTKDNLSTLDKPVHPSWEAKRAQKELMAKATFQGSKIVFGDDE